MVICSYAVWNLPRWSVQGRYQRVQSFRFCTSNFRFGSYGFIIPLLCRGLGFSLSIVAGTNLPPLQTGLVTIVLVTYTVAQATLRPWKGPAINGADTASSVALLILAGRSLPVDTEMEAEFSEYFTFFILMFQVHFGKFCFLSINKLVQIGLVGAGFANFHVQFKVATLVWLPWCLYVWQGWFGSFPEAIGTASLALVGATTPGR